MIAKQKLEKLYKSGLSAKGIAEKLGYSESGIRYLLEKYKIPRRSISEAIYLIKNPNGDPFCIKSILNRKEKGLFYISIGLYLGEGDKASKHNLKLGNSDFRILKIFLRFLREICQVREYKIKAELNIFDDVDIKAAINYWIKNLGIKRKQLRTVIIRKARNNGTYKNKSRYGTLSIFVSNYKLKKIIMDWCQEYAAMPG